MGRRSEIAACLHVQAISLFRPLLIAAAIVIASLAPSAEAQNGRPISSANADQFEALDSDVTCFFNPLVDLPIPGKTIRRGGRTFFMSFRTIRDRELRRLLDTRAIRSEKDPRFKFRRKKLTDVIKAGRTACLLSLRVRNAVKSALRSASTSTDASLDDFITLVGQLLGAASDPIAEYNSTQINILKTFKSRGDFDALANLASRAGPFFQIEAPVSEGDPGAPVSECPPEAATVVYNVPGVNESVFTSIAGTVLLREMSARSNPTATGQTAIRHLLNRTGLPATAGVDVCRLFVGPAGGATPTAGDDSGIAGLPESLQRLATAYQDALERCLGAYGANSAQTLAQFVQSVQSYAPTSEELTIFKDLLTQDVQSGRNVIVLAHSQGNLLAKQALDILGTDGTSFKTAVGLISVASPIAQASSQTYGAFQAVTLNNDVILQVPGAIGATTSNALSNTATISPSTNRFAVHDFVTGYLADAGTRALILDQIFSQKAAVTNGRQLIGQGFFQVTLTWNIPGDIDLHVFEPNGSHVFYASKKGQVGELDIDDIPGDGPENYFVCARGRLQEGDYRVEVNNYNGTTGTVANFAIRAGNQNKTYQVTVGAPNQGASNLPVATVTYLGSGRFILP